MKIKKILNKLKRVVTPRCVIFEYNLESFDFSNFSYSFPDEYKFYYAKDIDKKILKDFAQKYRKKNYYYDTILNNLNDQNVKGISIVYKDKELAMLSWLYLDIQQSKTGINKLPFYKESFLPMDGWVVKHHRGRGFHKYSIYKRFLEAYKDKKKYGYSLVYLNNVPALKDNDKFGDRIGKSYMVNIGYKFTLNFYNLSHLHLYFKKHKKLG